MLRNQAGLRTWQNAVRRVLRYEDMEDFITIGVPRPGPDRDEILPLTPQRQQEINDQVIVWRELRNRASILITQSLLDPQIEQRLVHCGWDPLEMDPKVTYDKVMEAIGGITQGGMIILIKELNTLQRDNFKTLHDLINRIEFLRSQLNQLGCPYNDKQIMAIHLIALQSSYPTNYDYWMRALEADNLSLQRLDQGIDQDG